MEKNRKNQLNLIVDRELIKNIDELAQANDMSRSAYVRKLIRQDLARRQQEESDKKAEVKS